MAYDEKLAQMWRDELFGLDGISEKRMMGERNHWGQTIGVKS